MSYGQHCPAVTGDRRPQLRLHRPHSSSTWWAVPGLSCLAYIQPWHPYPRAWCKHPGAPLQPGAHTDTLTITRTHTQGTPLQPGVCTHIRTHTHHSHVHTPPHPHMCLKGPSGRTWPGAALGLAAPLLCTAPVSLPCPCPEAGSRGGQHRAAAPCTAPAPPGWARGSRAGIFTGGLGGVPMGDP